MWGHPLEGTLSRDNSPPLQNLTVLQGPYRTKPVLSCAILVPLCAHYFMCSGLNWLYRRLHQSPIGIKALTTSPCLQRRPRKSSVPCRVHSVHISWLLTNPYSARGKGRAGVGWRGRRLISPGGYQPTPAGSFLPLIFHPNNLFSSKTAWSRKI